MEAFKYFNGLGTTVHLHVAVSQIDVKAVVSGVGLNQAGQAVGCILVFSCALANESQSQNCIQVKFNVQSLVVIFNSSLIISNTAVGITSTGQDNLVVGILLQNLVPVFDGTELLVHSTIAVCQTKEGIEVSWFHLQGPLKVIYTLFKGFQLAMAVSDGSQYTNISILLVELQHFCPVVQGITIFFEVVVEVTQTDKGICVIDLDTVMPGVSLYDFGDSLRSGANNTREDDANLDNVFFDLDLFKSYAEGFLSETADCLTKAEKENLPFGVKLMTFECGIRFLTDYLDGDLYFRTDYAEHNIVRARNQFKLVEDIEAKYDEMQKIVRECLEKYE